PYIRFVPVGRTTVFLCAGRGFGRAPAADRRALSALHPLGDRRADNGVFVRRTRLRAGASGGQKSAVRPTFTSFAVIAWHAGTPRPTLRIYPLAHRAVERGIRPIRHTGDMAVFQRVDMDVIRVTAVVLLVANQVLPISPLPDSAFAAAQVRQGALFVRRQVTRKTGLEHLPAHREIGIARRK